jgi:predicted O-methyltransferase YrrM
MGNCEKIEFSVGKYTDILYKKVKELNAKVIVEIGVDKAYSTLVLLKAAIETNGHLYSVDILSVLDGIKRMHDSKLDLNYWTFTNQDSLEYIRSWKLPIDILYLDSNHLAEHTFKELEAYSKFIKSNGVILLHDTLHNLTTNKEKWDVMFAVHKFMALHSEWIFEELLGDDEFKCGLGMLSRRKD